MQNKLLTVFEEKRIPQAKKLPEFRTGDTVRVVYKIQEGAEADKFRLQPFEGVVIRYKKGGVDSTFTVRKMSAGGVGVERVFPVRSTFIDKIEVISMGRVRRARLYYLRNLSGKSARIKSRFVKAKKEA